MAPATAPQVSPVRIPLANPDAIRTAVSLEIPSPSPQAARTACAQAKPSSMSPAASVGVLIEQHLPGENKLRYLKKEGTDYPPPRRSSQEKATRSRGLSGELPGPCPDLGIAALHATPLGGDGWDEGVLVDVAHVTHAETLSCEPSQAPGGLGASP